MKIRTVIVDDEPLAREWLRALSSEDTDLEIVAEYSDGASAIRGLQDNPADLVFLDVQMPEADGFDVAATLEPDEGRPPLIVFVTAYDQYAIRAFETHALDYLLKPFDGPRFRRAVQRAKQALQRGRNDPEERLAAFLASVSRDRDRPLRVALREEGRVTFVDVTDIDWIEAHDNHVVIHIGKSTRVMRRTLASLADRLAPRGFLRVHRSTVVNAARVREIQPLFHGEHVLILKDGTRLTVGRRYRGSIDQLLEGTV